MRSALTSVALGLCGDTCHVRWRVSGRARRRCGGCSGTQQGVQWSRHACSDSRRAPSPSALRAGLGPAPGPAGRAQQGAVDSRAPPPASMRSSHQTTSACAVPAAVAATCTRAGGGGGLQPSQCCPTHSWPPSACERGCNLHSAARRRRSGHPEPSACAVLAPREVPAGRQRARLLASGALTSAGTPGRRPQGVAATVPHMWPEGRCMQDGTKRDRAARLQVGRPPAGGRGRKVKAEQLRRLRQRPQRGLARLLRRRRKAGRRGAKRVQVARARASLRGEARRGERRAVLRAQGALGGRQVLRRAGSCSRLGGRTGCHTQHGVDGSVCLTVLMLKGVTCRQVAARQHNRHLLRRLSPGHSAARQGRHNSACGCQVMDSQQQAQAARPAHARNGGGAGGAQARGAAAASAPSSATATRCPQAAFGAQRLPAPRLRRPGALCTVGPDAAQLVGGRTGWDVLETVAVQAAAIRAVHTLICCTTNPLQAWLWALRQTLSACPHMGPMSLRAAALATLHSQRLCRCINIQRQQLQQFCSHEVCTLPDLWIPIGLRCAPRANGPWHGASWAAPLLQAAPSQRSL